MNRDVKARKSAWDSAECPVCGKEFFPSKEWAYRLNFVCGRLKYKPVCSYGCLCRAKKEFEAEQEAKRKQRKRAHGGGFPKGTKMARPGNSRRVRCINTGKEYESLHLAELDMGVSRACIGEICRGNVERHKGTGLSFEFLE